MFASVFKGTLANKGTEYPSSRVAQRLPHDAVVCSSDVSSRTVRGLELRQRGIPSHVRLRLVEAQQLFQPTSERDCPGRRRWAVRAIEAVTAF